MSNSVGGVYGLTVLTAIIPGQEAALRTQLAAIPQGSGSPFSNVPTVHFGRWVVIDELRHYRGMHSDHLKSQYLLFTVCVDGDLKTFVSDLCSLAGPEIDSIWSHCVAYPGAQDVEGVARWVHHNQIETTCFINSYEGASVADVTEALAFRQRLIQFAIEAQALKPEDLQRDFRSTFAPAAART